MRNQTNEKAFESAIERAFTGSCLEWQTLPNSLAENPATYNSLGYLSGKPQDFDAKVALDVKQFWAFLENTQAAELAKCQRQSDWQRKIIERFDRLIKKQGLLYLLEKGLEVDDAHFVLFYPAPLVSSSDSVQENFAKNSFSVTRQVHHSLARPRDELDMVLFINGIPFATFELKNAFTHQTARYHGQKQYKEDRDPKDPIFNFARCLVHFALDTDEAFMTTKLAGNNTVFLPFNKGYAHGQGNPPNPNGHKTAYLWADTVDDNGQRQQAVFAKDSVANIIAHFVRLDGTSKASLDSRNLYFPRYHQLDVVRKLVQDVSAQGVGKRYLIQHSAGSGKSNSITWAAFQLIETYPNNDTVAGAKGIDAPLFDSVIVVTDRKLLDKQTRTNFMAFAKVKNIIAPANSAQELKQALEGGKKIIITTLQKFPWILDGIADLSSQRFAVIIDEAHSSHGGTASGTMNKVMGATSDSDDADSDDGQEKILQAFEGRKMRGNASYFAFTATPKNSTLEKFGIKQDDGSFKPFHLYSMKQAIEEGFILDVLANYTTYRSYYELEKSIQDNPEFDKSKAQKQLRAYVERNQHPINIKSEIILEHFIPQVFNSKRLKGKAKGMVVTQNIETAIRYFKALTSLLAEKGNPFKIIIAFSGEKVLDGITYTESDLNGFADTETPENFDTDDYRLLVVANKYLTGFDQPKLCTMYVDKKLQGVLAVQALSRLNRSAAKWGKKTEDVFVLDFFNDVDDIQQAFDPFYTATHLSKATDINVLNDLKSALDETEVYQWSEVEAFNTAYFKGANGEQLSALIDVMASRFEHELGLSDDEKADIKIKAKQFVKVYAQVAPILPPEFSRAKVILWEQLYWCLKFLVPKLIVTNKQAILLNELLEAVDLSSYGLERKKIAISIVLDDNDGVLDPTGANPRGAHGGDGEKDALDEIVKQFNEKWFQGWQATPEEKRIKFVSWAKSIQAHPDFASKFLASTDTSHQDLAYAKIFEDVMMKSRKTELDLARLLASDSAFKLSLQESLIKFVLQQQVNYAQL
jgi:type I restriction enzyme R subunit